MFAFFCRVSDREQTVEIHPPPSSPLHLVSQVSQGQASEQSDPVAEEEEEEEEEEEWAVSTCWMSCMTSWKRAPHCGHTSLPCPCPCPRAAAGAGAGAALVGTGTGAGPETGPSGWARLTCSSREPPLRSMRPQKGQLGAASGGAAPDFDVDDDDDDARLAAAAAAAAAEEDCVAPLRAAAPSGGLAFLFCPWVCMPPGPKDGLAGAKRHAWSSARRCVRHTLTRQCGH